EIGWRNGSPLRSSACLHSRLEPLRCDCDLKRHFSAACESAARRENKILAQIRFPILGYCNDGPTGQGPSLPRRTTFSLRPALGCLFPSGYASRGGGGGGNHRRNPDRLLRRSS